ncbi:hypothetical protein HHK02_00210 [Limosilactobacillus reuteri]|uniref:FtsK gamma domain-containing protein n=1 Tax=Limosilactobacillus reuteri TaxID=1598 RepID=A0A7L6BHV2_LIMRT|nr:hypothetical protein [Limosilactobacillus reuteri]QLQ61796.1 hypothetical protein HHK02_00210 [Limosilactobacillus reuteri]
MVFNKQELRKIIQAPISVDMKIDLIEQLHHQDVQKTVNKELELISKRIDTVFSIERAETNVTPDLEDNVDPFLLDALMLKKKTKLTIPYLQRTFKIGYNRANRLLAQCEQVMNEEEE